MTAADVLRVANQYLHKEELKVLVVGNAGGFEKQLAALGPVTPIDITIPSPEAKAAGAQDSPALSAAMPGSMAENTASASGGNPRARLRCQAGRGDGRSGQGEFGEDSAPAPDDELRRTRT